MLTYQFKFSCTVSQFDFDQACTWCMDKYGFDLECHKWDWQQIQSHYNFDLTDKADFTEFMLRFG
jgi:hypothetical protein